MGLLCFECSFVRVVETQPWLLIEVFEGRGRTGMKVGKGVANGSALTSVPLCEEWTTESERKASKSMME